MASVHTTKIKLSAFNLCVISILERYSIDGHKQMFTKGNLRQLKQLVTELGAQFGQTATEIVAKEPVKSEGFNYINQSLITETLHDLTRKQPISVIDINMFYPTIWCKLFQSGTAKANCAGFEDMYQWLFNNRRKIKAVNSVAYTNCKIILNTLYPLAFMYKDSYVIRVNIDAMTFSEARDAVLHKIRNNVNVIMIDTDVIVVKQNNLTVAYIQEVLNENGFVSEFKHYDSIEAYVNADAWAQKFLNRLRFRHKMLFPNKLFDR
jgi:hypothetical protein